MKKSGCLASAFILTLISAPAISAPLPGANWDWQLSVEQIEPPKGIRAFGTDPDSVTREQIMMLNEAGIYTICYVSVGTLENWRSDKNIFYDQTIFNSPVVGKKYEGWPDEFFLDITNPNLRFVMQKRFLDCALKGFKAIEPDNMDVYINDSGFNISAEQTITYIKQLAKDAHDQGLEIGQKNVPELTNQLVGILDFVITESCYQDNWCEDALPYIEAGKPIFDAEYDDRKIDFKAACAYAKKHKISMILKKRDLGKDYQSCE
ncbi:MAG: endo alpha-1,4 polygalactosaminidase [Devosiaceae bacterium]|nr:endo alpha-1,4 polygalactosaminidase [Devosiaceae bacterium]